MSSSSRTIVFGDIHGCHEEWQALMDKLKVTAKDQLVTVGDLCSKGPSTRKTLDIAMKLPNLKCVMGNHDHSLLMHWKNNTLREITREHQKAVVEELGKDIDRYMGFIDKWPAYLELDECIVVHAGIRPDVPLAKQHLGDLIKLRKLEDEKPWWEHYKGKKLIVHGHWAAMGLVVRDNVIGLDTGCVYGRELTALTLPSRETVSVKAKKIYCAVD